MKRTFRLSDSAPDPRRDVQDEIAFHLEMRAREMMERGVPEADARRLAATSFGDRPAIEAECREIRDHHLRDRTRREEMRGMVMDLRFALRGLRRDRGFAAAAILTLALGIGATAAVFTVVNGVLLRPLPYSDPARLAMIWTTGKGERGPESQWPVSAATYVDVRDGSRSLQSLAAFRDWPYVLGDASEPEQIPSARVSPALFPILGVHPLVGRLFTDAEAVEGGPAVVLISHDLWQRRFGESPDIVGRQITLSGQRVTVIGVMPPGFAFPRGAELPAGLRFPVRTELWTPLFFTEKELQNRGTLNLAAVGRLRPGASFAQMDAELAATAAMLAQRHPRTNGGLGLHAIPLREQSAAPMRRGLLLFLGAVGFVLLIACANVTNLLLARAATRQREFALRSALGAARFRIARQLVTENVVLALAGGFLGMLIASWGSRALLRLVPGNLPRADDISVDWRVLFATAALAVAAGITFGLATAWHVTRRSAATALQGGSARATDGIERALGRRMMVAAEVALSLMLLIGAGLLAGSFARLQRIPPGFDPEHALTAQVLLPIGSSFDPAGKGPRWAAFFGQLTERLGALPGVRAAGAVSSLPLSGAVESGGFSIEGRPAPAPAQAPSVDYSVVSGEYFRAMGIRLIEGRTFDPRDRAKAVPVVIVNREFVRRHFPGQSAIGHRMLAGFDFTPTTREIIGVVDDVRQTSLDAGASPAAYVPEDQMPYPALTLVIRTDGDPGALLPAARRELRALDPTLAFDHSATLNDVLSDSLARQRFSMIILTAFAGTALCLSLVGLYGVIALNTRQRRREMGIRMALGARPLDVLRLVLREGMRLAGIGVVAGLLGALVATRVMQSLLFGISTTDRTVFGAAALLVATVALLATYLPARGATRVHPAIALRME
ncbi:MAG: ABC transporter permease [Gemmatimonadota bacterium]|nr:ABC transporter permease [Gemmatimonadota bacterium]